MRIRLLRCVGAFSLVLGLAHCGGHAVDPEAPDANDPLPDAAPDQKNPKPDSSPTPDVVDAPSGTPVWDATSRSFEFTQGGGWGPVSGRECMGSAITYRFAVPARLVADGCVDGFLQNWSVDLGDAALAELRHALEQLRTTDRSDCGFDAPEIKLTVLGSTTALYESNFYRGCVSHIPIGKGIDYLDLAHLAALLQKNRPIPPIQPPDAGPDVDADTSGDRDVSDADAFVSHPVWRPNSTGFDLREWGGFPSQPTDHDECTREDVTFYFTPHYAPELSQLSARGCSNRRYANWDILLYPSAEIRLLTTLQGLETVPAATVCGADLPYVNMTVLGPDGGRYQTDFYPPLCGYATFGESISWQKLGSLTGLMRQIREGCVDDRADAGVDASARTEELELAPILEAAPWETGPPPGEGGNISCRVLATGNTGPVRDN